MRQEIFYRALENSLARVGARNLSDAVALARARNTLSQATFDLIQNSDKTGRNGLMPRIPIPKANLSLEDLRRLGFVDSRIAVPELGQAQFLSYRHPLHNLHIHDHGDLFNMHLDILPSMAMQAARRKLTQGQIEKLLETIPTGVIVESGTNLKNRAAAEIADRLRGAGHAILEGIPEYALYGAMRLNPNSKPLIEETLANLDKNYLKSRYGYTRKVPK
jgi:hypothetical protein